MAFCVLIFLFLIVIRFSYVISLATLYIEFVKLLFSGMQNISGQIDFRFVDSFVSLILIVLIPIILVSIKK